MLYYKGLMAKELTSQKELAEMAKLRHDVYCCENKWRPKNRCQLEVDEYDSNVCSYHGVFYKQILVGCQRIIRRPGIFMIDEGREYNNIGATIKAIKKSKDTVEASRLAVHKDYRKITFPELPHQSAVALMLFKSGYYYCLESNIRFVYAGTTTEIFDYHRLWAPFTRVSERKYMDDGSQVEVGLLDWREFELKASVKISKFFLDQSQFCRDEDCMLDVAGF